MSLVNLYVYMSAYLGVLLQYHVFLLFIILIFFLYLFFSANVSVPASLSKGFVVVLITWFWLILFFWSSPAFLISKFFKFFIFLNSLPKSIYTFILVI